MQLVPQLLFDGCQRLSLELNDKQVDQLLQYVSLLQKWNKVYSLTAITDNSQIITHHILDGLSIVKYLNDATNIADVGSGMGVPGVILAIMYPHIQVTAIDRSQKKNAFLRQVAIKLKLDNFKVVTDSVESYKPNMKFDCVISRAFSNAELFVKLIHDILAPDAKILMMKGQGVESEVPAITGYKYEIIPISVPFFGKSTIFIKNYDLVVLVVFTRVTK